MAVLPCKSVLGGGMTAVENIHSFESNNIGPQACDYRPSTEIAVAVDIHSTESPYLVHVECAGPGRE
jgi:hypothetical protein